MVKFEKMKYVFSPFLHPTYIFNTAFSVTENEDFLIYSPGCRFSKTEHHDVDG